MNKTFYRKYRPTSFADVIGQDFIKKTLMNSIVNNKIGHAYIFSGPRGTGKTSISKIFAKAINCLNNSDGDCCNKCENCNLINSNTPFDVVELDAASNNGVSEIRTLIDSTTFLPTKLKKKVYIIDESHMLTNSAWNALLKTIEDPPSHVIFIFATTEPSKIISTINSRCERYNFSKINSNYIEQLLIDVCKKEAIECDDKSFRLISLLSEGSVRDSLSILSQLSSYSNKITEENINNIFGLVNLRKKIDFIKSITFKNITTCLNMIDEFYNNGADFYRLTYQLIQIILDMYIFKKTKSLENLSLLTETTINSFNISTKESLKMIEIFEKCLSDIKFNGNEKFYLELAAMNCISLFDFSVPDNREEAYKEKTIEEEINDELTIKKEKNLSDILTEKNIGLKEETNIEDNNYMSNVRLEDIVTNRNISNQKNIIEENKSNNTKEDLESYHNLTNSKVKYEPIFEVNQNKMNKIENIQILNFEKMFKLEEIIPGDMPKINMEDINQKPSLSKDKKEKNQNLPNLFQNFANNNSNNESNTENKIFQSEIKRPNIDESKTTSNDIVEEKKVLTIKKSEPIAINKNEIKLSLFDEIFFSIVENNDNPLKDKLNEIFLTIKGTIPSVPEEGYIVDASKILLASKNGFVFLFDNSLSSKNLNYVNKDKSFIEYIKDKFNNVYYVIGISKDEAKTLGEEFKKLKASGKVFNDVDKSELLSKIDNKTSAKDIALELFKEELEKE